MPHEFLEVEKPQVDPRLTTIEKLLGKCEKEVQQSKETNESTKNKSTTNQKAKVPETFGGFKKGFLFGSSGTCEKKDRRTLESAPKHATQPNHERIHELKVKNKNDDKKNVIEEVQEAIKAQIPLLQSDEWITPDLLEKILKHPKLGKQFQDPRFSKALSQFQSNPQEAMQMFNNNPEIKEFIQTFCAMMGDHFTKLGEEDDKRKPATKDEPLMREISSKSVSSSRPPPSKETEEETMAKVLADPITREILADPRIHELIGALREDPQKAQQLFRKAEPDLYPKIQKLIEVGLLGTKPG